MFWIANFSDPDRECTHKLDCSFNGGGWSKLGKLVHITAGSMGEDHSNDPQVTSLDNTEDNCKI